MRFFDALSDMSSHPDAVLLGQCADCDTPIPSSQLLVSYETADGWPCMYAECPACEEIVRPV